MGLNFRKRQGRVIRATWRLAAVFPLLATLSACAPTAVISPSPESTAPALLEFENTRQGWWTIAFGFAWDTAEAPRWHLGTLLADQVLAPVVTHTEPRLSLWRFHRRAAHDGHGHRFRFLFYTDPDTARVIKNGVTGSATTQLLVANGELTYIDFRDLDAPPDPGVGAISDPDWPQEVQRAWPWFIMGVSQSWLRLIAEVRSSRPSPENPSLEELLDYYLGIDQAVTALWREHGQHAYLHHLNALFGYQPLVIRENSLKRF